MSQSSIGLRRKLVAKIFAASRPDKKTRNASQAFAVCLIYIFRYMKTEEKS